MKPKFLALALLALFSSLCLPARAQVAGTTGQCQINNGNGGLGAQNCGGGGGSSIEVNGGTALSSPVNFQNGTSGNAINFSNPSGSVIQGTIQAASVTNAMLANSTMTVDGSTCTLGGSCSGLFANVTPGDNTTVATWLINPSSALGGSTPNFTILGAASDTNTAAVFSVDTPSGSHQNSLRVGNTTVDEFQVCWQPGPQGEIVIGSAVTCQNIYTTSYAKFVAMSVTAGHTIMREWKSATGDTADLNQWNSASAPSTNWNFLTGYASVTGTDSYHTGGTFQFGISGNGIFTGNGFNATTDGVHWGSLQLVGNASAPSIGANSAGWGAPASASFTSYLCLFPATAPAGQVLSCGTPSSEVSTGTWMSAVIPASLTTTSATSDNVTVTGATSSSHCSLAATNASAAINIATTYISSKTANQITVTHTATSGLTYDVLCTPN